jgi:hypothetical protein
MSDIDLLVRKEHLGEVESKLLDMGYLFDGHGKTKEFYLEHRYHWVFAKRSAIAIEIHWHINGLPLRSGSILMVCGKGRN